MNYLTPGKRSYRILAAARKVHAAFGPGLPYGQYGDALEAEFPDGFYQMERNVRLPVVGRKNGHTLKADFTFRGRRIMVRVMNTNVPVSSAIEHEMWRRLCGTGCAIGLVLNFGRPALDQARVIHRGNCALWKAEEKERNALSYDAVDMKEGAAVA
jgi:GxxExxY protein